MAGKLLGIDEAMVALGISRSTLWRRLRSGDLPSVKRSGRRLVRVTTAAQATRQKVASEIPPFTEDNPMFRLMGAGRGGGRTPGARDKHAILDA